MSEVTDVKDQLLRALRNLTIATVFAYLFLVGIGVFAYIQAHSQRAELRQVATSVNGALCTLRADLEQRVEASRAFLRQNPTGIDGISDEDIEQSIIAQEQAIDALASLRCGVSVARPG